MGGGFPDSHSGLAVRFLRQKFENGLGAVQWCSLSPALNDDDDDDDNDHDDDNDDDDDNRVAVGEQTGVVPPFFEW